MGWQIHLNRYGNIYVSVQLIYIRQTVEIICCLDKDKNRSTIKDFPDSSKFTLTRKSVALKNYQPFIVAK